MKRDVVRLSKQLVQVNKNDPGFPRRLFKRKRIKGHDIHSEAPGSFGDKFPNASQPNDAQRLPVELDANEFIATPFTGFHGSVCLGDIAADGQHQGQREFSRGHAVCAGRIHDDDASHGCSLHIDVIDPYARATDNPKLCGGRQDAGRHLGAATNDKSVVFRNGRDEFLSAHSGFNVNRYVRKFPESIQSRSGQFIRDKNSMHLSLPIVWSNFDLRQRSHPSRRTILPGHWVGYRPCEQSGRSCPSDRRNRWK